MKLSRSYIISNMPPAIGVNSVAVADADNADIIRTIEKNYPEAVRLTENTAWNFKGNTVEKSARNIWQFLRTQIAYVADPASKQKIKMPNRLLLDGKGDCKSFALFTAAILANLGLPVSFRYASYNFLNSTPTHVYVTTKNEAGKEFIIDGVWSKFNEEKQYSYKRDIPMTVYTLSGVPVSGAKTIYLSPGRNAFLSIVALNVRGLAHKLAYAVWKNKAVVKDVWEKKLGGNFDKLLSAINTGKNKPALLGESNESAYDIPTDTVVNPVLFSNLQEANAARAKYKIAGIGAIEIPVLLAAAAPVIASVSALLASVLPKDSDVAQLLSDAKNAGGDTSIIPSGSTIADDESGFFGSIPPVIVWGVGGFLALKLLKII